MTICLTGSPRSDKEFCSGTSLMISSLCSTHHFRESMIFSSSCATTAFWTALATASRWSFVSFFLLFESSIPCSKIYRSTEEWTPENENESWLRNGIAKGGTQGRSLSLTSGNPSRQNASSAAPGARPRQTIRSSRVTLSIMRPAASSLVVAKIRNREFERASSSRVWPPDISSVKKGNRGISCSLGDDKIDVRACAC